MTQGAKRECTTIIGLLDRIGAATTVVYERERRENPHRFTGAVDGLGSGFLFVENVARMLACGVDYVRRIPRNELPASKVGNRLIYARSDVERFIALRREGGGQGRSWLATAGRQVAISPPALSPSDERASFDPVAHIRKITKKEKQADDESKG